MNPAPIITRLTDGCPSLQQVVRSEQLGSCAVDVALLLKSLLDSSVTGRVYPMELPASPAYPAITYQRVSQVQGQLDGYTLLSTSRYLLVLWSETYAGAESLKNSVTSVLEGYSPDGEMGVVEVDDVADQYDEDIGAHSITLEVSVYHLDAASQAVPMAMVHLDKSSPEPHVEKAGGFSQRFNHHYVVVFVVDAADRDALENEITAALLGQQLEAGGEVTHCVSSDGVDVVGRFVVWRGVWVSPENRRRVWA